jgi:hypothetical protein
VNADKKAEKADGGGQAEYIDGSEERQGGGRGI